jgi:hypothetical protein
MAKQRPQSMDNNQILSVLASGNHSSLTQGDWQAVARMEAANNNAALFNQPPIYNYPSSPAPQAQPQPQPQPQPQSQPSSSSSFSPSYVAPSYTPPAAPPPPKPPAWITTSDFQEPKGVKQADPDIVIFNTEAISPEFLVELNYEDISGMELINISRSDLINGANVAYSPIKNLSALRRRYNPNNIISMPELSSSFFARFGIDLVLRGIKKPFFDEEGNLVIEIEDVRDDELIEVEVSQSGTINEVEFI